MGYLPKTLRGVQLNGAAVWGMAAMYVGYWLHYWGGPLSLRFVSMELAGLRWISHLAFCALIAACVLAIAWRRPTERVEEALVNAMQTGALVCGLVGTVLSLSLVMGPSATAALHGAAAAFGAGAFTGVAMGSLLCAWCVLTARLGVRSTLACNICATALGGAAFMACVVAPQTIAFVASVLCPLAGYLCMGRYRKAQPAVPDPPQPCTDAVACGAGLSKTAGAAGEKRRTWLKSLAPILAVAAIFGFSNGFISTSFEVIPESFYLRSCYGVVVGTMLASFLVFLATFILKLDAWQLVFKTTLPLLALGYFLLPSQAFWVVGIGIHAMGYQYFFIVFWSLLGSKQLRRSAAATVSVPLGLVATEAATALGAVVWSAAFSGIDGEGLALLAKTTPLVALFVAVAFERPDLGLTAMQPGTDGMCSMAEDVCRHAVGVLRTGHALSPRESDVCVLLGMGLNRREVAEGLCISLETARTHTSNVYRKLGVHSQRELLALIEQTAATC